jgi:Cu/Ag efflux protein CusF
MKDYIKLVLILATISVSIASCNKQEALTPVTPKQVAVQTYSGVGVIKNVDKDKGKLTIDHEDIKGYMSALEMDFLVSGRDLLETTKIGDKVEFEIERTGEKLVITKLTKIGEVAVLKAAAIYKANCAECHGEKGEGAKKGISLIEGHALHHTEAEHIKQVTYGESEKMPAYKDKLTPSEIGAVVKFVRDTIQQGKSRDDSGKHKH